MKIIELIAFVISNLTKKRKDSKFLKNWSNNINVIAPFDSKCNDKYKK